MPDNEVVGKLGRVVCRITRTERGEVMIPIRGGTEAFFASLHDPKSEPLEVGARVKVVDHFPPRTVYVAAQD